MDKDIAALSERERETLRLLLGGHDAKSIARDLGLSVHTVNERLRDARRKLGVSSSREAARRLAQAEQSAPQSLVDKDFGVAATDPIATGVRPPQHRQGRGVSLAWLAGGMLIMSLIIAAVALSFVFQGSGTSQAQPTPQRIATTTSSNAADSAAAPAALQWLALIDAQRWAESWRGSGSLARAQVGEAQWTAQLQPVRQPLGSVSSRTLQKVTKADSLPGAPAGTYELLEFRTDFAQKSGAVETVVMTREASGWKPVGYFIR
jgi:DNA-binding CsgD family transcriptional regulator